MINAFIVRVEKDGFEEIGAGDGGEGRNPGLDFLPFLLPRGEC